MDAPEQNPDHTEFPPLGPCQPAEASLAALRVPKQRDRRTLPQSCKSSASGTGPENSSPPTTLNQGRFVLCRGLSLKNKL